MPPWRKPCRLTRAADWGFEMSEQSAYLSGLVLGEESRCTLNDLCRLCGVDSELVRAMIDEGIITPEEPGVREWQFTWVAVRRVWIAVRLQQDLQVNLPGCALALDLLDELEELRRRSGRH